MEKHSSSRSRVETSCATYPTLPSDSWRVAQRDAGSQRKPPRRSAEFDQQWREVMAAATEALDLSEVLAMLEPWRWVAPVDSRWPARCAPVDVLPSGHPAGKDSPTDEPPPRTETQRPSCPLPN